jgi:TonB family protein
MLEQLVESKNNAPENVRKGRFLVMTLGLITATLFAGWTYSLFAKNYVMTSGEMEIANLVAPVSVMEDKPPASEPIKKTEKMQPNNSDKTVLKELYEDMSRTKEPLKNTLGEKEVINARQFDLKNIERGLENNIAENVMRATNNNEQNCGLCGNEKQNKPNITEKDEFENETVKQKLKTVSTPKVASTPVRTSEVINGRATNLIKPAYPASARPLRIEGAVNVQVTIDERGNVISASAVAGHPILRQAAVQAARQSKFSPTILNGTAVKVTGIIVYNFKLQ